MGKIQSRRDQQFFVISLTLSQESEVKFRDLWKPLSYVYTWIVLKCTRD